MAEQERTLIIDSEYQLLLKEILEGKEIDIEDERFLERVFERLEEYPQRILEPINASLAHAHFALEQYAGASLSERKVLLEDPANYDVGFVSPLYKGNSEVLQARMGLCYSINNHFAITQTRVLSILPLLKICGKIIRYYKAKSDSLQKKLETSQETQKGIFPNKKSGEEDEEEGIDEDDSIGSDEEEEIDEKAFGEDQKLSSEPAQTVETMPQNEPKKRGRPKKEKQPETKQQSFPEVDWEAKK